MGFFLFILVNLALFIRPAELFGIEELERIYQVLILACLAASLPEVQPQPCLGGGRAP